MELCSDLYFGGPGQLWGRIIYFQEFPLLFETYLPCYCSHKDFIVLLGQHHFPGQLMVEGNRKNTPHIEFMRSSSCPWNIFSLLYH